MHVSMYWRRYLFWASVLSCNIFWRRVNDDISSFYIYTHVYAHLLHLSKAFKLKIAIIKTNTRNLTFFPSYIFIWSTKMQFLRIPCSNFHLIKTYLQVIGCPIENCCEYVEIFSYDNKTMDRFYYLLHTETHHIFYLKMIIKDVEYKLYRSYYC